MNLDVKMLARILSEELEKDGWGDISPFWLMMISDGLDTPTNLEDDELEDAQNLQDVLERVVKRLQVL